MATYRNYGQLMAKVQRDLDLEDETFIQPEEMVGYCNEAIKEASAEITTLHKDYFLTNIQLNMTMGQNLFNLPANIYANKIRGLVYVNGSIIYTVRQYLKMYQFEDIAYTLQYGAADEYRYMFRNDSPGNPQINLVPNSRDQGPLLFLYYIRESQRIPQIGEFYNTEPVLPAAVNFGAGTLTVQAGQFPSAAGFSFNPIPYVTGDQVQLFPDPLVAGSVLPGGLQQGVTYYVIFVNRTTIKLATTQANAAGNIPIALTTSGVGRFILTVAGTANIQQSQLIDIPEFYEFLMQWMKVRCLEKEGDPRYEAAVAELQGQRKIMVDTLTEIIDDNATEVEGDFSNYLEMS